VRRLVALALLPLVLAPTASAATYPWARRVSSATKYAKGRSGRVAFAVKVTDGHVYGRHIHETHYSASAVKAMLMVAYLRQGSVRNRSLGAGDKNLLHPMITRSDNGAASRVMRIVGAAGLRKLAAKVGMKDFSVGPAWANARLSPYDQTRFFFEIDALIPPKHQGYALTQLKSIIPAQRWGLPPDLPAGWDIYFKGGWRPSGGGGRWLVNQSALLIHGTQTRLAISVLTDGDPGFTYGTKTIEGVGKRLLLRAGAIL
jgi:beta-lactamase class A